jgi:hypothetical protein
MACHGQLKMAPVETFVAQCESYIVGYNLKNEPKQSMVNLCRNKPLFIPCEKYDYVYFNGTYNSSGINTTVITNFINTKAAAMLYPRAISNLTSHQNPLLSDITLQIDGRSYPHTPGNSLSIDFIKQNIEAAGLNSYFHSTQSVEDLQCKGPQQAWGVRGRLNSDNTDCFHIMALQRPSAGNYFFVGLDKISVSIKLQANFISTTNAVGKTNGNMDNLWLPNEEDREPGKPDPEYKGHPDPPTVPQELNTTSPLLILVRNCYFKLDVDRGLSFISNKKWKQILAKDFPQYSGNNYRQQYQEGFGY